jgi:DNA-binding CsgD family transcriptional regulator
VRRVLDDPGRGKVGLDVSSLTARETEVLTLIAEGKSSNAIADGLSISVHTVNRHRANLMDKLKIHRMADLVRYAISHGLVVR